jgi:hypothetical protein
MRSIWWVILGLILFPKSIGEAVTPNCFQACDCFFVLFFSYVIGVTIK